MGDEEIGSWASWRAAEFLNCTEVGVVILGEVTVCVHDMEVLVVGGVRS